MKMLVCRISPTLRLPFHLSLVTSHLSAPSCVSAGTCALTCSMTSVSFLSNGHTGVRPQLASQTYFMVVHIYGPGPLE